MTLDQRLIDELELKVKDGGTFNAVKRGVALCGVELVEFALNSDR